MYANGLCFLDSLQDSGEMFQSLGSPTFCNSDVRLVKRNVMSLRAWPYGRGYSSTVGRNNVLTNLFKREVIHNKILNNC